MKRILMPALLLCVHTGAAAQTARPQVMVVGTYHMANPGADMLNLAADDVLTGKRQAEISRLVDLLAAFNPTVVALEYLPSRDSLMNARYAAYRGRSYTPGRNESEQVGFRLASKAGLTRIVGIDHRRDLDLNAVMTFAMANGFERFASDVQREMQARMAEANRQLAGLSVPELIAEYSGPGMEALNAFYLRAAQVGRDSMYVGVDMTSAWYDRNLHIYANLARTIRRADERVLVLIGAGHVPLLRSFIRDAGEWDLVDPLPLLRR